MTSSLIVLSFVYHIHSETKLIIFKHSFGISFFDFFLKYSFYFEVDSVQSISYKAQRRLLYNMSMRHFLLYISCHILSYICGQLAMPKIFLNKKLEYANIK